MALSDPVAGMLSCPQCGQAPPHNWRVETRVTLRDGKTKGARLIEAVDRVTVHACIICGHELKTR